MPAPARRVAFDILRAVHAGTSDLPTLVAAARERLADPRDQALVAELTAGTLRRRGTIDHVLGRHVHRPLAELDGPVLDALRLGAYQLLYLDRVPAPAAVNDSVQLVKRARKTSAAGMVNAVLRAVDRDRGAVGLPPDPGPDGPREAQLDHLSITHSHPRWLVERWLDRVGYQATLDWVLFNNEPAPLTLRANTRQGDASSLRRQLAEHGVATDPTRLASSGLVVRSGAPLALPLARAGRFWPQDEASQLVGEFAAAGAGLRVLDVCAAPGGKTLQLASSSPAGGLVVAMDVRARRVDLLRRTLTACGASSVQIVRADGLAALPFSIAFDLVLVDAPCSGLGTIRREPEVRWRRTSDHLAGFAAMQTRLLARAAERVARGGRLVYATCSSEPEENDHVVARFLADQRGFETVDPREACPSLPVAVGAALTAEGCLRTAPPTHGLEGYFAAMLLKSKHL